VDPVDPVDLVASDLADPVDPVDLDLLQSDPVPEAVGAKRGAAIPWVSGGSPAYADLVHVEFDNESMAEAAYEAHIDEFDPDMDDLYSSPWAKCGLFPQCSRPLSRRWIIAASLLGND